MNYEEHLAELFDQAAELSPDEQAVFLAREFADKPTLLAELQSLLGAHAQGEADHFLHGLAIDVEAREVATESAHDERVGQVFGRYQIMELIGEGGMGEVYLAEDTELNRKVALKLIKSNLKTKEILRRFSNERQILAQLNHENIARLLDVGTSTDGLSFLVMEYVDGQSIDDYRNSKHLSTTEQLKLFRQVCSAVQYAHQNLVIHRDLKPGNILVTSNGQPKLLDFGIAKLLDPQTNGSGEATATMLQAMTPEYASPEQVKGEPITTATDVYSLGVLLYELLTGRSPYKLKWRTAEEITRAICEQEPAKPSSVVSGHWSVVHSNAQEANGKEATEKGKGRSYERLTTDNEQRINSINPKSLRGDLDNIVLKALRKESTRRYASVEQFSEDVRRHLEGLTVIARKDTIGYRTSKFIQRNKLAVAVAALVLVTLIAGIISTSAEWNRAKNDEASNRQLLYAAQMSLAYQAWETSNVGRALDLLEAQRPKPGDKDLRGFEWYLLWRLTHDASRVLRGPAGPVSSVAFSPDGSKVAAGSFNKAQIFDAATGRLLTSLDTTSGQGQCFLTSSPNGKYLAGGFSNGSVLLWETATGQLVRTFNGQADSFWTLAFSPDGRMLTTAGADHTLKLWTVESGELSATLKGHQDLIISVAFSPDGKTIASGSGDHTVKLWNVASGKEIGTLRGHPWWVLSVTFSPDGKTLATAGSDGEIKLWDVERRRELGTINGDGTELNGLRFSPDGKTLAAASRIILFGCMMSPRKSYMTCCAAILTIPWRCRSRRTERVWLQADSTTPLGFGTLRSGPAL